MSGGCVTSVKGIDGKEYTCQSILDYDNDGICPVCLNEIGAEGKCSDCGYDEDEDNAFELAVTMAQGGDGNS